MTAPLLAMIPFLFILSSFMIVLVSGAQAATDASKGDFQKAAPALTITCIVCVFMCIVIYALQSHKGGSMFKSMSGMSVSGGGGSYRTPA